MYQPERNQDIINSELLLFDPILVNSGVEKMIWVDYLPVNQLGNDEGPIDIVVPGTGPYYVDLKRSRICVKAKIVKADGTDLEEGDIVTPTNLWLHSNFGQVDTYLQQKLVSSVGTSYPYKAYLDCLLNYGIDSKESIFQTQLYFKDTAEGMEQTNPGETPINQGLIRRNNLSKLSKIIDMEGPLYSDICQLGRFLLNGLELRIRLWQSKNAF